MSTAKSSRLTTPETDAPRGLLSRLQLFIIGRDGRRSSALDEAQPIDEVAELAAAIEKVSDRIERLDEEERLGVSQDSRVATPADRLYALLTSLLPHLVPLQESGYQSLLRLRGRPLSIYLDHDLSPRASPHRGSSPHPTIVISIPKAGTYFISELMRLMGLAQSNLHLSQQGFSDYRFASIQQMREEYLRYTVDLPLAHSSQLIGPGQFAVGHLPRTPDVVEPLKKFRKIFIHRDLRDALVSYQRWFVDAKRAGNTTEDWKELPDGPERMLAFMEILGQSFFHQSDVSWLEDPEVYSVSFETLYGDRGADAQADAVERLWNHLEISDRQADPAELIRTTLGNPTKTKSAERSKREKYWSKAVEAKFREFNGHELNARLGHEN